MHYTIRVITQQEALEEFEAELERLQEQDQGIDKQYQSGLWALAPVYAGAHR